MIKVNSAFRGHPELQPTGKLSLLGESCCSPERLLAYARRRNPRAPDNADKYIRMGAKYGVRGDVAYCQATYDTRGWTADLAGPSWAPYVRKDWDDEAAIEGRVRLLYALAMDYGLPEEGDDPEEARAIAHLERFGWRGQAPCWEDLNGKWADPGNLKYAQYVVAMWRHLIDWRGEGESWIQAAHRQEESGPDRATPAPIRKAGTIDWSSLTNERMKWLRGRRLLPEPAPHPDRKVTWSELAGLLREWEKGPAAVTIGEERGSS